MEELQTFMEEMGMENEEHQAEEAEAATAQEEENATPEKVLEDLDKDKDGQLTLVELEEDTERQQEISNQFAVADHDKNGMLTIEELKTFMEEMGKENEENQAEETEDAIAQAAPVA